MILRVGRFILELFGNNIDGGVFVLVDCVKISPTMRHEKLDALEVSLLTSYMQGCTLRQVVFVGWVCSMLKQLLHSAMVLLLCGFEKRSPTVYRS